MIRPVRPDGTIETGGVFVPIQRRRVIERIASAAMQRVVLIVAPAGYGKSVALRQYLESANQPYVRFDVMSEHAGLLGFLRGFADAIADVAPDARATLAGAYERNVESASAGVDLALWMHSHLKSYTGTVAIDDLHVAQDDRDVTRFLASLIERTRDGVQWIIASRSTQGLPIGTWLAYGESDLAIDEHDLKFSVEEAKEAARSFRLGVRDDELYELLNLTDGWATAMSFALRSSTRSVDLRSVSSTTREMIYRYLAEQVYGALSEEERLFLETAALLSDIDVEVMAAVGFDRATAMLEELRGRVAFIQERKPAAYRLHDLFRDFVLHQRELRGDGDARSRALNVGIALEGLGHVVPALRLYVENHDAASVLRLLEEHGVALISKGFVDDVDAALAANLGPPFENGATVTGLRGLLALIRGKYGEGERLIAQALRATDNQKLKCEMLLRTAISRANQNESPIEFLRNALEKETIDALPRLEMQAFLAVSLARAKQADEALEVARGVSERMLDIANDEAHVRILLRLGSVQFFLGKYEAAKPLLLEAAELAGERAMWSVASKAYLNLSVGALFGEDDPALSLWFAQQGASAALRAGDFFDLQSTMLAILSLETRRGNAERAAQAEKQLAELRIHEAQRASFIVSSQAHRQAWSGKFGEAHRLFATVLGRQSHAADTALVWALHAYCLAMDDRPKESAHSVERAVAIVEAERADAGGVASTQVEIAGLFAIVAEVVAGRLTAARRLLGRVPPLEDLAGRALFAVVERIVRIGRSPAYDLAAIDAELEAIRGRGYGGYAIHILNAVRALSARPEAGASVVLTAAELRIIRSLADGLAPKEIAADMGRSVLTVQTHIKNLIEKLGCHGRAEAIAAARQLGLISNSSSP